MSNTCRSEAFFLLHTPSPFADNLFGDANDHKFFAAFFKYIPIYPR